MLTATVALSTVALSAGALCAHAKTITTMLPNGQRVEIPDGSASLNGPASAAQPPAPSPEMQPPSPGVSNGQAPANAAVAPGDAAQPPFAQPPSAVPAAAQIGVTAPPMPAANAPAGQPEAQPSAAVAPDSMPAPSNPAPAAGNPVVLVGDPAAAPVGAPSLNPLSGLAKASFVSFIEKPLFDPTRRLPPPVAPVQEVAHVVVAPPPPPETPPTLHLLGIIQGERNMAVVHRGDDTKTEVLSNGDKIDGWEVIVPPSLGLKLKKGDRVVDFTMFNASPPGAPGTNVAQVDPDAMTMEAQQAHLKQQRNQRVRPPRPNY